MTHAVLVAAIALSLVSHDVQDVQDVQEAPQPDILGMAPADAERFAQESPENARLAYGQLEEFVAALPMPSRLRLGEAARAAASICPETNARVELLATLDSELASLEALLTQGYGIPSEAELELQRHFARMRDALGAQAQLDRTLRVAPLRPLSMPEMEDLVSNLGPRVGKVTAERREEINGYLQRVHPMTLGLWNAKGAFFRTANLLQEGAARARAVKDATRDPLLRERMERFAQGSSRLAGVIWQSVALGC